MFTPDDENGYSYFVKYDLLTDVVACPGIEFTSLENSCYVPIEEIFGPSKDDFGNLLHPETSTQYPSLKDSCYTSVKNIFDSNEPVEEQSGTTLVKKLIPPKTK